MNIAKNTCSPDVKQQSINQSITFIAYKAVFENFIFLCFTVVD